MAGRRNRFKGSAILLACDTYRFLSNIGAVLLKNTASPLLLATGALFFGPGEVASDHIMQKEFSDRERATMGSLSSFAASIFFAVAALAIGAITDRYGLIMGTGFGAILSLISLPFYAGVARRGL